MRHAPMLISFIWKNWLRKAEDEIESLTSSQSTFRKNGWPMMSAKPVWGWQPRRSLGSCGSECEKRMRDSGRLWWKGKITSPIPEKKGGESEKRELARKVDTFPPPKKKKTVRGGTATGLSDPLLPCWGILWGRWQLWLTTSVGFGSVFPILLQEVTEKGSRGGQEEERMRWCQHCCCYEFNPAGYARSSQRYESFC